MENKIKQFYLDKGIFDTPLHESCIHKENCWKGLEEKIPKGERSKIYLPYIGGKYNELRILIIGINMNNYGGTDAAKYLINKTKEELCKGKKKLFSNTNYKGSMLFYQIAKYSNILYKSQKSKQENNLANSLDYIAYTNHIKCSPDDDSERFQKGGNPNSKPNYNMWSNCGTHILKNEIDILKPKYIFILGKSSNLHHFNEIYNWSLEKRESHGEITKYYLDLDNEKIGCFVFPHPGVPKGIKKSLFTDFEMFFKNT